MSISSSTADLTQGLKWNRFADFNHRRITGKKEETSIPVESCKNKNNTNKQKNYGRIGIGSSVVLWRSQDDETVYLSEGYLQ